MALIKCPECGKEVSDQAKMCVGCGYELTNNKIGEKRKFNPLLLIISAVLVLSFVVGLAIYNSHLENLRIKEEEERIIAEQLALEQKELEKRTVHTDIIFELISIMNEDVEKARCVEEELKTIVNNCNLKIRDENTDKYTGKKYIANDFEFFDSEISAIVSYMTSRHFRNDICEKMIDNKTTVHNTIDKISNEELVPDDLIIYAQVTFLCYDKIRDKLITMPKDNFENLNNYFRPIRKALDDYDEAYELAVGILEEYKTTGYIPNISDN